MRDIVGKSIIKSDNSLVSNTRKAFFTYRIDIGAIENERVQVAIK
jgi:hypothetical protein